MQPNQHTDHAPQDLPRPHGTCPGCGRPPATCWLTPCLYLAQALGAGYDQIKAWAEASGMQIRSTKDEYERMANQVQR